MPKRATDASAVVGHPRCRCEPVRPSKRPRETTWRANAPLVGSDAARKKRAGGPRTPPNVSRRNATTLRACSRAHASRGGGNARASTHQFLDLSFPPKKLVAQFISLFCTCVIPRKSKRATTSTPPSQGPTPMIVTGVYTVMMRVQRVSAERTPHHHSQKPTHTHSSKTNTRASRGGPPRSLTSTLRQSRSRRQRPLRRGWGILGGNPRTTIATALALCSPAGRHRRRV
jgi:hypothetical protein